MSPGEERAGRPEGEQGVDPERGAARDRDVHPRPDTSEPAEPSPSLNAVRKVHQLLIIDRDEK